MAQVDYGQDILNRLPKRSALQQEGNPGHIRIKDAVGFALERVEEAAFSASDLRFLENATGIYLDYWGDYLGIKRALGLSKQNILLSDPTNQTFLNMASGSDYLGTIEGLLPANGAAAYSTQDWAKDGIRSFLLEFPGYVTNEAVYFLSGGSGTNQIPTVSGDFREVNMIVRGMPVQQNLIPVNVATGTDALGTTEGFIHSSDIPIVSSTEQHFAGSRSLKTTFPANIGFRTVGTDQFNVPNPAGEYSIGLRFFAPEDVDLTFQVVEWVGSQGYSTAFHYVGRGSWYYFTPWIQFTHGGDKASIYINNVANDNPAYSLYLDSFAFVEGNTLFGNPNASTGALEQKCNLNLYERDNAGALLASNYISLNLTDSEQLVTINRTFTNPNTTGMNFAFYDVQNNPLWVYVDKVWVDDGQLYQNWNDESYRQKLLSINSDITIAAMRDTLSKILECEPGEITIVNNPSPKTVNVTIPYGSDVDLIEALIGDMLLPGRTANITEA